jgi:hypothetical protein
MSAHREQNSVVRMGQIFCLAQKCLKLCRPNKYKFFTQVNDQAHPKTHSVVSTEPPLLGFHMHHFAGFNFNTISNELCLYKQW